MSFLANSSPRGLRKNSCANLARYDTRRHVFTQSFVIYQSTSLSHARPYFTIAGVRFISVVKARNGWTWARRGSHFSFNSLLYISSLPCPPPFSHFYVLSFFSPLFSLSFTHYPSLSPISCTLSLSSPKSLFLCLFHTIPLFHKIYLFHILSP